MTLSAVRWRVIHWRTAIRVSMYIGECPMLARCIVDVERDVSMRNLSLREAVKVLEDMKVEIEISKAAVTQNKRNEALDLGIEALQQFGNSEQLPSAQPEWIPCSARLPEIGKKVLLSEPNTMFIAEYHGSGDPEGLWLVDGCHHYLADVNECAWMPLPEPYQGGQ